MLKLFQLIRKMGVFCAMMIFLVSCQRTTHLEESTNSEWSTERETTSEIEQENTEKLTEDKEMIETTEEVTSFQGKVISCVYEDYYMYWDDLCVLIVTYTAHFEGAPQFGLIGYNGTENPVLFIGNTKQNGYGMYDMYCFKDNRVYKSDETIEGKLYYNRETKEFASLNEDGVWNLYTYYSNHIIWLREQSMMPGGFEPMTLTATSCNPPPMVENIREFIIW